MICGYESNISTRRYTHVSTKKIKTFRKEGTPPKGEYQEPINIEIIEVDPNDTPYKSSAELKHCDVV
jgi:hypothetical protein